MHVLPLRIQHLWLTIDTSCVEQILGEREWLRVPGAPAEWPGVLAWQGRAVAVLELSLLLGLAPNTTARRRTLIVKAWDCLVAIPVDEIHEAQLVADAALRPAQVTRQPYAVSELSINDTLMPLFDPIKLVSETIARNDAARAAAKHIREPA